MKLTFLVLSVLFISLLPSQATRLQDRFDLGISQDGINCVNARKLMHAADSDSIRLNTLADGITAGLKTLLDIHHSLDDTCRVMLSHAEGASFLQTSPLSKSSLPALQQKLHNDMVNLGLNGDLHKKLSATLTALSEVSDRSANSREDSFLRCEEGSTKLRHFNNDLTDMLNSIQNDYIGTYLNARYQEINQVLDSCPITQTGLIAKTYLGTGNEFEHRVPRARFQDYKVAFDQPFTEVPNVAVSLTGFDLDTELPAVAALVPEVSESGFTLRVHLVPYARLYSIQVSYLATLPEESGIMPKLHMVDYQHDSDMGQLAESVGPRSVERSIAIPSQFENANVGVVTFLNGFSFGAGADPRLKVSVSKVTPNDFTLRYSTSGSTRFLSAVTYNLIYKTSSNIMNQATEVFPTKESSFYSGFGPRTEETQAFSLANLGKKPEVFVGLFAFDFTNGYHYRVSQDVSVEDAENGTNVKLSFNTIGDTKVNMVKSSVFHTCTSRLC